MYNYFLNTTIIIIFLTLGFGCKTESSSSSDVLAKTTSLSCTCEFDNGGKEIFVAPKRLEMDIESVCQTAYALALSDACKNNTLPKSHRVRLTGSKDCKKYNKIKTQVCYTQDDWGL